MAVGYLLPIGALYQALSDQGVVGSGFKINTYLGGSVSTPVATYTDSTLGVLNSNPIAMGSNGRFQSVNCWVPTGTLVKLVLTDSNNVAIVGGTIDNVAGVNDVAATSGGGTVNFLRADGTWTPPVLANPVSLQGPVTVVAPGGGTALTVNGVAGSPALTVNGSAATPTIAVGNSGVAFAVDCSRSNVFTVTMTGNVPAGAMTLNNMADGQTINVVLTQDGTGSRTLGNPTGVKWPAGTVGVLSTAAGAIDILTISQVSGTKYASLLKAFA